VCRLLIQSRQLLKDTQAGSRGSFRIIFVGFGPAEISHNAVAEVFGDVAAITGDRLGCGAMVASSRAILPDQAEQLFRSNEQRHKTAPSDDVAHRRWRTPQAGPLRPVQFVQAIRHRTGRRNVWSVGSPRRISDSGWLA
jgi:hypothetical protein